MKPIFLGDWAEENTQQQPWNSDETGPLAHLKSDFEIDDQTLEGVEIMLAFYTYEDYSGDAFVLFRNDSQLYEVNGSHCSCYGLEGQWEPEETTIDVLEHRLNEGSLGVDDYWYGEGAKNKFAVELRTVLAQLKEAIN
ncbi:hypothetical protein [Cytobacillus solani]|uniref:hypothetical protein n=1 Tax=Cytobacillus solani TaxID=1637975 RepID=UPI0006FBEAAC|nr:hypothetical protein [Cytobacillus solani]